MKNKLLAVGTCLLLLITTSLQAQKMKRVVKTMYAATASHKPVNTTSNGINSCPVDQIIITSQAEIDNFSTTYPACTTPKYLLIDGAGASPAITNLDGLSSVTQVLNTLSIQNTSITSLGALSGLTYIGDSLDLRHNPLLASFGLNNITTMGNLYALDLPLLSSINGLSNNIDSMGGVHVDSTGLTNLAGLGNIKHIEGELSIGHTRLTDLGSLSSLQYIRDYIWLESDTVMTHIGLTGLQHTAGFLFSNLPLLTSIAGISDHLTETNIGTFWMINTGLTDLTGMDHVTSSSNFYLWVNNNMATVHGLEGLQGNIGGGISIWGNGQLTNLSGLHNITNIDDGTLEIASLPTTDLSGFGNIVNIGRGLWVTDNYNLTSLEGLNHNLVIQNNVYNNDQYDSVRIINNNNLALCSFPELCNYLSNGPAEIHDNATGCTSVAEVAAACNIVNCPSPDAKTWTGANSSDWDDPNNWDPAGVPGTCTTVTIPAVWDLPNYPYANADVSIGGLIMEQGSDMDMNGYTLYVVRTLHLDNGNIDNLQKLSATKIYAPWVHDSYFTGDFSCLDFGGHSEFTGNSFNGNVVLADSSGRSDYCAVNGNYYGGNLSCTQNSDYGNFYLGNSSASDYVQNDLTVKNRSQGGFSVGLGSGNPLRVNGNFTVDATMGSVDINNFTFTGGNNAHIIQAGTLPIVFDHLIVEKYGYIYLDQDVHVRYSLDFGYNSGRIFTEANKLLILDNNAIVNTGGYATVNGPMKKIGNQAFTFPMGALDNNTLWNAPISITAPASPTDEFTAQYFHHDPSLDGYDTSHYETGFGGISGKEYWVLNRNAGTSNVKVGLSFDQNRSANTALYQYAQVAGWENTLWKNRGTSGNTGSIYSGTVYSQDALTQYGPLTISTKLPRIPVITMNDLDTIHCRDNYFNVSFTLDTAALPGNYCYVQISDSLGNFSPTFNYQVGYKQTSKSDTIPVYIGGGFKLDKNYKLRVTATLLPDTSINTKTVRLKAAPQLSFSILGNAATCLGNGIQKYYPSIHEDSATYSWTVYGGTFTTSGDTALVTWTSTGSNFIQASAMNSCGYGPSAYTYITVKVPAPTVAPVINNIGRWLYSSAAPSGTTYQWLKDGVAIPGATNPSYYAAAAGNYTAAFYTDCGPGPVSNIISFASAAVAQTISFPAMADKTYGDAPFVPAATASSGLPVAFSIVSGPATINTQTNVVAITGTGVVVVQATQQGNNTYDTAAPVTRSFTVNKAAQTITFTTIPDQNYGAGTVTLSATASSGLPVSFSVVSGPATVAGNALTLTGIGTVTVRASQAGDANYLAAATADRSFCAKLPALDPINGYTNLCPATATYSVNNVPGATYFWRIAGGSVLASTSSTASVNWTTPGVYTLLVSATGNCGTVSATDTLLVNVINSIQPDSVHSMLPADGVANQQLPLNLSWVPAQPGNFYTFDIYIWPAGQAQPSVPFVAGLTTVNYTIPLSSGLAYNQTYKWMVVAHNGSCTQINTGPVQQFSLIPLPDLVVSNVQIPATAFSGQTIAINWTVSNAGPGKTTTNQSWTDAVFLSFDNHPVFSIPPSTNPGAWNQLDFPVRPLLVATKANVTALDNGQQYTNSVNFTLPVNYSQPLYAYVITNYPNSGTAPLQTTYANDTASAPQPIAVTLSPAPDLRVDTVFTPATTFSGSTINLTYKVKNYGVLTPAGANWTDKVYISQSSLFNLATAIPVKFPKANGTYYANASDAYGFNNTQLQADSSYTKSLQVVVPNYISGTWFIYVYTNPDGTVYEGPASGNNVNRSQVQVFLTPTPHLTVNTLTVPVTTASTTQPIGINWNISNTGFNDNIEKNKGHYFVQTGSCLIPPPPCTGGPGTVCVTDPPTIGISVGDSVSFGSSYWMDKVYLSKDAGSLNTATAILVNQATQGVLNSGLDVSDNFNTTYPCQRVGTNLALYNVNTFNVIRAGSNHPKSVSFTVPDTLSEGDYYVYVFTNANKDVYEYPGTPETRRSALPISIQRPDVIVSGLAVPANASGGQQININYNVLNNGAGAVYNHVRNDQVYVSSSPVFNASAQLISTKSYTESLPVGTPVPHTITYAFPAATSGTRYIYVYTNFDSAFKETNMANNISAGAAISVVPGTPADLVVSFIQQADTVGTVNSSYFKYTVTNNGPGTTTGTWTDSIFVSCTPAFNPATNLYIASRPHGLPVAAGGTYTDSFYLNIPLPFTLSSCFPQANYNNGYFFVKTNADNVVYEGSNGNNNVAATSQKVLKNPLVDHIVTTVTAPDTAIVGRPYTTSWTVKNLGINPGSSLYSYWHDGIYFSPDSLFNTNAVMANYYGENTVLSQNQTYSDTKNAIPPVLPTGDYYVLVKTNMYNNIPAEVNLANNANAIRNAAGAAKKIHLLQPMLPDLTDSIIAAPYLVAVGQPLTLVHKVSNKGIGVTYPDNWGNNLYLSTDFIVNNGNDILIAAKNHSGALQAGQAYTDTTTAAIAINTTPGNYVLISQVNAAGNVFESDMTNNTALQYVTVYSPAPADLVVDNISHPDTVYLGYTMDTAKWVIRNNSANAANGISADGIYLSKKTVFDSTAILLGIKNKTLTMAPLQKDTLAMTPLVNNVVEGDYNIIVRTDVLNNIVESDKTNNTGLAESSIYVAVKELPMEVLTPNTLQSLSRYYKLIIPDSLNGATIQVILKSNDSLSVKNQLFIGKGYVPSAAHFDYTYGTPNYGNQDIVMASVTAGTYYITTTCATSNPPVQNITLKATRLPFAILNVQSSSGGNTGSVTVKISGSLFAANMTATLSKGGTTIPATAVYFTNGATVYASFNLQGKPLGIYDVTLTKTDGTTATLANAFSIVNADNGGLITGGGVNTGQSGSGNDPGCDPGTPSGLNSQLVIEIVAPDKVFVSWPFVIQINYKNPTNVDIPAQVRVLYSEKEVLMSLTPDVAATGTTALQMTLTEQDGPPGIIRAGGSGTITIYAKSPVNLPGHTIANFRLK